MLILNKIQTRYQGVIRGRIMYGPDDFFTCIMCVQPKLQEPRFILVAVEKPKVPRHTHNLKVNIRKDWIDAAYTHQGCTRGPVNQDEIDCYIWGA